MALSDELTLGDIKMLQGLLNSQSKPTESTHPMIGKHCVIRTYSAGVHIGTIEWINPENSMELKLKDCLRLWRWADGGLSLSAVATNGIKGGRLNKCDEILLTNVIEMIPTTAKARETYDEFIEDKN